MTLVSLLSSLLLYQTAASQPATSFPSLRTGIVDPRFFSEAENPRDAARGQTLGLACNVGCLCLTAPQQASPLSILHDNFMTEALRNIAVVSV